MRLEDKILDAFLGGVTVSEIVRRYGLKKEQVMPIKLEAKEILRERAEVMKQAKLLLPRHKDSEAEDKWKRSGVRF